MKLAGPIIHPGEILSDELNEVGVSASDLARAIGVPASPAMRVSSSSVIYQLFDNFIALHTGILSFLMPL